MSKEERRAYEAKWREKNRDKTRAASKRHYAAHREAVLARQATHRAAHKDSIAARNKAYTQRIRLRVLTAYSPTKTPSCACCGETTLEFLAIDHIDGGGAAHRREVKGGGYGVYFWLIRNDFPDGFRVLCHNCNFAAGKYGACPHQAAA